MYIHRLFVSTHTFPVSSLDRARSNDSQVTVSTHRTQSWVSTLIPLNTGNQGSSEKWLILG